MDLQNDNALRSGCDRAYTAEGLVRAPGGTPGLALNQNERPADGLQGIRWRVFRWSRTGSDRLGYCAVNALGLAFAEPTTGIDPFAVLGSPTPCRLALKVFAPASYVQRTATDAGRDVRGCSARYLAPPPVMMAPTARAESEPTFRELGGNEAQPTPPKSAETTTSASKPNPAWILGLVRLSWRSPRTRNAGSPVRVRASALV